MRWQNKEDKAERNSFWRSKEMKMTAQSHGKGGSRTGEHARV